MALGDVHLRGTAGGSAVVAETVGKSLTGLPSKRAIGDRRKLLKRVVPYLLLLPAVVALVVVIFLPVGLGVVLGFLRLSSSNLAEFTRAPFAGVSNFRIGLSGPIGAQMLNSLGVTVVYTASLVLLSWFMGVVGAVFLSDAFRARNWLRSLLVLPYAIPGYASTIVWAFIFEPGGAASALLVRDLHLLPGSTFWLGGDLAFVSMLVTSLWGSWPFALLMMLAGVQSIDGSLYEACSVDGGSRWEQFWYVTLPQLRDVSLVFILITGLWSFNNFTTPFVLFGTAVPASADLLSARIYIDSFVDLNFGLGSAMSVVMIVVLFVGALLYVKLGRISLLRNVS